MKIIKRLLKNLTIYILTILFIFSPSIQTYAVKKSKRDTNNFPSPYSFKKIPEDTPISKEETKRRLKIIRPSHPSERITIKIDVIKGNTESGSEGSHPMHLPKEDPAEIVMSKEEAEPRSESSHSPHLPKENPAEIVMSKEEAEPRSESSHSPYLSRNDMARIESLKEKIKFYSENINPLHSLKSLTAEIDKSQENLLLAMDPSKIFNINVVYNYYNGCKTLRINPTNHRWNKHELTKSFLEYFLGMHKTKIFHDFKITNPESADIFKIFDIICVDNRVHTSPKSLLNPDDWLILEENMNAVLYINKSKLEKRTVNVTNKSRELSKDNSETWEKTYEKISKKILLEMVFYSLYV